MRSIWVVFLCGTLFFSCTSTVKNTGSENTNGTQCTSSSDCGIAEMCNSEGQCVAYCSSSYPCSAGYSCNLELNQCESDSDGDTEADSEVNVDGDTIVDGDNGVVDGDENIDGDYITDGDGVVDGDDDEIIDGDDSTPACNLECGFGWICNESNDACIIDRNVFPYYCLPCNNDGTCNDGNICYTDSETFEQYCAPPCIENGYCMDGATCYSNYCLADSQSGCGLSRPLGGACNSADSLCESGLECLESINGRTFPNGICTSFCSQDQLGASCTDDSSTRCTGLRSNENDEYAYVCLNRCDGSDSSCRNDYTCAEVSSSNPFDRVFVCVPPAVK